MNDVKTWDALVIKLPAALCYEDSKTGTVRWGGSAYEALPPFFDSKTGRQNIQ